MDGPVVHKRMHQAEILYGEPNADGIRDIDIVLPGIGTVVCDYDENAVTDYGFSWDLNGWHTLSLGEEA